MPEIVGIDLSGPTNTNDTALVRYKVHKERLEYVSGGLGYSDGMILSAIESIPVWETLVVALDAPLSYEPGGGDRVRDKALRRRLVAAGLPSGTVMTPTMTRMAYLTLRGISVARLIKSTRPNATIVEVHPGGSMVLNGIDVEAVTNLKSDQASRNSITSWFRANGFHGFPEEVESDHYISALACCLSAKGVLDGISIWSIVKEMPYHPYDLVC